MEKKGKRIIVKKMKNKFWCISAFLNTEGESRKWPGKISDGISAISAFSDTEIEARKRSSFQKKIETVKNRK